MNVLVAIAMLCDRSGQLFEDRLKCEQFFSACIKTMAKQAKVEDEVVAGYVFVKKMPARDCRKFL